MTERTPSEGILAVFRAAAVGDALGAATEGMHRDDIPAVFGGPVATLLPPPPRAPFAAGLTPGRLTDDATQMLAMAEMLLAAGPSPTIGDAVAGLLAWAGDADVFARFAGPTTRLAIESLRAGTPPAEVASPALYSCVYGTSNGAAMRAPAAGCARIGDPDAAAYLAVLLSAPTHNTQIAFAGAGTVAAAIAAGLAGEAPASFLDWLDRGAAAGEALAPSLGRVVGGPSVRRRIHLAADIGRRYAGDPDAAMAELEAVIGNGVAMAEAVPCAVGLAVASELKCWPAVLAAVNGGNDSDTIAMIAGALTAAWSGSDDLPAEIVAEVERVNGLDLPALARRTAALSGDRR
jgi:ADP-ribosylglycohydrolase